MCCKALHTLVRPARTAETLMWSRYSAYVLRLEDSLFGMWHPDTWPRTLDLARGEARWPGLTVYGTVAGGPEDDEG